VEDAKTLIVGVLRMVDTKVIGVANIYHDPNAFGYFTQSNQFAICESDLPKVHKHFELFYLNRLHYLGKQKAQVHVPTNDFKPKLNKKTVEIAENYRNKVADQINENKLSTFDWLAATGNKEEWRKHAQ
jgi:hypothetical protein